MFFWWMPFMPLVDPADTAADQRPHTKREKSPRRQVMGARPRTKAKAKGRRASGKEALRRSAARKAAGKARKKRQPS
jgi:hypothetical protein